MDRRIWSSAGNGIVSHFLAFGVVGNCRRFRGCIWCRRIVGVEKKSQKKRHFVVFWVGRKPDTTNQKKVSTKGETSLRVSISQLLASARQREILWLFERNELGLTCARLAAFTLLTPASVRWWRVIRFKPAVYSWNVCIYYVNNQRDRIKFFTNTESRFKFCCRWAQQAVH